MVSQILFFTNYILSFGFANEHRFLRFLYTLLILKQKFILRTPKQAANFEKQNLEFVKTRFVKPSDEQINYYNIEINIKSHQANENRIRICHWS